MWLFRGKEILTITKSLFKIKDSQYIGFFSLSGYNCFRKVQTVISLCRQKVRQCSVIPRENSSVSFKGEIMWLFEMKREFRSNKHFIFLNFIYILISELKASFSLAGYKGGFWNFRLSLVVARETDIQVAIHTFRSSMFFPKHITVK